MDDILNVTFTVYAYLYPVAFLVLVIAARVFRRWLKEERYLSDDEIATFVILVSVFWPLLVASAVLYGLFFLVKCAISTGSRD